LAAPGLYEEVEEGVVRARKGRAMMVDSGLEDMLKLKLK
jgi:hypothetical protein